MAGRRPVLPALPTRRPVRRRQGRNPVSAADPPSARRVFVPAGSHVVDRPDGDPDRRVPLLASELPRLDDDPCLSCDPVYVRPVRVRQPGHVDRGVPRPRHRAQLAGCARATETHPGSLRPHRHPKPLMVGRPRCGGRRVAGIPADLGSVRDGTGERTRAIGQSALLAALDTAHAHPAHRSGFVTAADPSSRSDRWSRPTSDSVCAFPCSTSARSCRGRPHGPQRQDRAWRRPAVRRQEDGKRKDQPHPRGERHGQRRRRDEREGEDQRG